MAPLVLLALHIPRARGALDVPSVLVYLEVLEIPAVKEWNHWLISPNKLWTMKWKAPTHQVSLEPHTALFSSLSFGPLVKRWDRNCTFNSVEEGKQTLIIIFTYFQTLWILELLYVILRDHLRVQDFLDSHSLPGNRGRDSQMITSEFMKSPQGLSCCLTVSPGGPGSPMSPSSPESPWKTT